MKPIYLDYAATTPVDPRVAAKMMDCLTLTGSFANPSSQHYYGLDAHRLIEEARAQVADCIGAESSEIVFTSGATEANNLAIKGAARLLKVKGNHIITMQTEHKSVLDPCQQLMKEGFKVTYLPPESDGLLNLDLLKAAMMPETILVSIMHVNNETGVIQPIDAIAQVLSERRILFHVDAVQSVGKLPLNMRTTPVSLLSVSAHKVYGPKGIGGLYLRKKPRVRVEPLIHGGGHEQGLRSGTLATHQIVGMGAAFALAKQELAANDVHIKNLRHQFLTNLAHLPFLNIYGSKKSQEQVPHILNLGFSSFVADAILAQLPQVAATTASACQGKGVDGSHVLRAMQLSGDEAKSAIRFSFGKYTTVQEIDLVTTAIKELFNQTQISA